jgi:Ser/Thr protein kinase RdoA (MazF antagonist)
MPAPVQGWPRRSPRHWSGCSAGAWSARVLRHAVLTGALPGGSVLSGRVPGGRILTSRVPGGRVRSGLVPSPDETSLAVNDAAVVGRILREYHCRDIEPSAIRRLAGTVHGVSATYQLELGEGGRLVVRACRADAPVPIQFRTPSSLTMLDWLSTRAATLIFLEAAGYPAPRLVRTHSGDPVGMDGAWLTLAATYVEGTVVQPSLAQLGMLGAALGRLHSVAPGGVPGPGEAAWYPETAIPATLARLDAVARLVPADWRRMFEQFQATALAVQERLPSLPRGLVHGDAWPANAVQTGPDTVTLIDWDTGGLGLPILDLGVCLLECLLDPVPGEGSGGLRPAGLGPAGSVQGAGEPEPWDPAVWHVQPDEDRIAAVARGYSAWRQLSAGERAVLLPAIRFGAAYVGAIHFEQALAGGVRGASMDARLERLRNRLAVSNAVAQIAARHLASDAEDPETIR